MRNNERGRSMIEMLGVLAIVGVLSVGGIAGYSKAMVKVKNNRLITELSELVMNIRTMYIGQHSYSNINEALLIKAAAAPHNMVNSSTSTLSHVYGGSIKVFTSYVEGNFPRAFELYLTDINSLTCIAMVTMDWGQDVASGFQGLYVGNEEITTPMMEQVFPPYVSQPEAGIYTPGTHEHSIPLTISDAAAACTCDAVKCSIGLKYI